ncbi:LOW QUALITY PROTEIN: hypothetical protein PHMEG_00033030 [Phytophthora megakarya]|uniref:Eukaryotic/viral aspartic protease n=1 Tax=Phytophthora megakarya TaxID=4795 RepID=A0A225UUP1_9STRA|nr:LOW QUALITY PROTEIN: hypothetical protein PHMEG_00033030 [Phytophthora megakarya]
MLEARSKIRRTSPARSSPATTDPHQRIRPRSPKAQIDQSKFFNAAMDGYLAEEREANKDPASTRPQHQGSQDVEMESIRSSDHRSRWEYDLDDVDLPTSSGSHSGKDQDEDRARAWISKVKSAFMRDQASDDGKYLTFADLLAVSAKNWYRQLNPLATNRVNYYEVSGSSIVDLEYRSDESPLDYLYRLNVARLRGRLKIKDGNAKERREHVDHYIETLEDQDLAERLTLLRLADAESSKKAAFGSSKYRQKPTNSTPSVPAKQVRAIKIQAIQANDSGSDSESDGSGGSESDVDNHRKICLAANEDVTPKMEKESASLDPRLPERDRGHQDQNLKIHDPESIQILVAGGVLRARSAAKEDIPRITASSCVADVENCMTWEMSDGRIL